MNNLIKIRKGRDGMEFSVSSEIGELEYPEMQALRETICTMIGEVEDVWKRKHAKNLADQS